MSQITPPKEPKLRFGSIVLIVVGVVVVVVVIAMISLWLINKRRKRSVSGSFEFIGSWGRNRSKKRTSQVRPKNDTIYKPVETKDKQDNDMILPMSTALK